MARPVPCRRILALVLLLNVAAGPWPAYAATINLNFEGQGPLHAPKIVNGTNYQYDANGNLTDDGQRTYEWNLENRPSTIKTINDELSTTNYVYDGDGRRIVKSVKCVKGVNGVSDECQNSKLVYVNQYLQISPDTQEHTYYYPIPPSTAIRDSDSHTVRYLHPDHLGSTRLITNQEGQTHSPGQTLSAIDYYPYGESVKVSGYQSVKELTRYLYTGQELDAETALYNLNARLYNPATAHFISADPAQGPNRYAYALNNPLKFIDPSGNMDTAFDDGGGGGGESGDFSDYSGWLDRLRQWWRRSKQNEAEYFANCGTPAQCYFGVSEEELETATWMAGGFSGGIRNVAASVVAGGGGLIRGLWQKHTGGTPPKATPELIRGLTQEATKETVWFYQQADPTTRQLNLHIQRAAEEVAGYNIRPEDKVAVLRGALRPFGYELSQQTIDLLSNPGNRPETITYLRIRPTGTPSLGEPLAVWFGSAYQDFTVWAEWWLKEYAAMLTGD